MSTTHRIDAVLQKNVFGETHLFWWVAVLSWGVGDIATTTYGLMQFDRSFEMNPFLAIAIAEFGVSAMILIKLVVLFVAVLCWRYCPSPHRLGIPLGISVVGIIVTAWNFQVIVQAL